jgi:ABC-type transport system substrate-binding protein
MKFSARMARLEGQFRRLPKKLNHIDRIVIGLCTLLLVASLFGLYFSYANLKDHEPAYGGTLIEGVTAKSVDDITTNLQNLTGIGLVRFDAHNQVLPGLAKSYTISPDGKTYTFILPDKLNASEILRQLKKTNKSVSNDAVASNKNKIIITLKAPFSPLLDDLTAPTLTPGPYIITSQTPKDVYLEANPDFPLGRPYISQIDVKVYPSQSDLNNALDRGLVMAAVSPKLPDRSFNQFNLTLAQYDVLFFNLKNKPWNDLDNRRRLLENKRFPSPQILTVTLPDDPRLMAELKTLQKRFEPLNVIVKSRIIPVSNFQTNVVSRRNFDALLIGIDYGRDPDPYPFFHSSQIDKGQNLAGFSSKDADKILEQARLTTNSADRKKMYQDFENILTDQVPAIFVDQIKLKYTISDQVHGVKVDQGATASDRFANVWQWYLKTKK